MRTSIHVVVDGNGQPKALGLTLDQTANFTVTEAMLNVLEAGSQLIAGKAYDTNAILDHPTAVGATPVVPCRSNGMEPGMLDSALYSTRNLIERCFRCSKEFWRVATGYDKRARDFLSAVILATTRYLLRDSTRPTV